MTKILTSTSLKNNITLPKGRNVVHLGARHLSTGTSATAQTNHKHTLVVQASSSGFLGKNYAKITLNDFIIECENNENDHYRGLHVVIFNPFEGLIESAKVFDTYKRSAAFDDFIGAQIPQGYIVVAACMDECT